MDTFRQAEKVLLRARSSVELELWELEAEAHRRLREGRSFTGLTEAMVKWKDHLAWIHEAELMLAGAKHRPCDEQRPVCETIIRNLGRLSLRPVTLH